MRPPLIPENQTDKDDLRHIYNPNKYQNNVGNYAKKDAKQGDNKNQTKIAAQIPIKINMKNNGTKLSQQKILIQINPSKPTGLEPAPKDQQYDVPH